MSAAWMLQALLAGALLGVGALAAERVAGWFGLPRRAVWAAGMLGSVLLPALALWMPGLLPHAGILPGPSVPLATSGIDVLQLFLARVPGAPVSSPAAEAGSFRVDLPFLLGVGWLAASLAMQGSVAWTYARLRRLRARSLPMRVDGVEVRVADRAGPAVLGLVHPAVVVPRWVLDAPAEERRLILLHEREHVDGGDAWLLLLGTLLVAAMPWSLPLWWQHFRLRAAVETDCDARVLARGASRRTYAEILIRTAGSIPGLPLLSPTWGESTSQLERRIMSMTEKRPSHRLLRSFPLLAIAAGVVAAACDVSAEAGFHVGTDAAPPTVSRTVVRVGPRTVTSVRTDTLVTTVGTTRNPYPWAGELGYSLHFPTPLRILHSDDPRNVTVDHYGTVEKLEPGTSAWNAGLRNGDEVVAVNDMDARRMTALKALRPQKPGTPYVLRVRRGSEEHEIRAEVGPPLVRQDRVR
ncbi:MAG: hypothetical protein JO040_06855 [Gemmatimonadetes bacterium]|nr:hypothetical protein [Gemmatimonadota bacterium]